jgi:hypothetical protein
MGLLHANSKNMSWRILVLILVYRYRKRRSVSAENVDFSHYDEPLYGQIVGHIRPTLRRDSSTSR